MHFVWSCEQVFTMSSQKKKACWFVPSTPEFSLRHAWRKCRQKRNGSWTSHDFGKPNATTQRRSQFIQHVHFCDQFQPAAGMPQVFLGHVPVSGRTAWCYLLAAALRAQRPHIDHVLTHDHWHQRLQWAKQCLSMNKLKWRAALFSDENRFSKFHADAHS